MEILCIGSLGHLTMEPLLAELTERLDSSLDCSLPVIAFQAKGASLLDFDISRFGTYGISGLTPKVPRDSYHRPRLDARISALVTRMLSPYEYEYGYPVSYVWYDEYISEIERKINEYLNENLPLSLQSLMRSVSRRNHRRYYSPPLFNGFPTQSHDFFNWAHSIIAHQFDELFSDQSSIGIPLEIWSSNNSSQTDTLLSYHPINTHYQATQAFSPKGAGPAASRKPTALPQRK